MNITTRKACKGRLLAKAELMHAIVLKLSILQQRGHFHKIGLL